MAMTPQETYDAVTLLVTTGERGPFERMCQQLRSGELVMEWGQDGYLIRGAAPAPEKDLERYLCPGCNQMSTFVVGPTQAFCTNDDEESGCKVVTFNPSLPDGGLSTAQIVDLGRIGGRSSPPRSQE